ncbi:O-antigen polymerase [Nakamurella leprariae]|uniref:Oligosaccharide repeat unit polymerase n=1 Tax=Nakamurella leprariae TaxID=2803911 RepID=A0A938YGF1_9ACTN|nr:O-antigen polymerase [Nakamurella leprariae]MBM9469123.1 oligosaccharide repeat unit polymerase [Nakamurella leprariae]
MPVESVWLACASLTIGLVGLVVATRGRTGDLLAPFSTSLILLISIFGIRPLFMAADGAIWFYGADVSQGTPLASLVGLAGITALVGGHWVATVTTSRGRRQFPTEVELAPAPDPTILALRFRRGLVAAIAILGAWLAITLYMGGGTAILGQLFAGRSAANSQFLVGVPALVPALPVVAAVVAAVQRVTLERVRALSRSQRLCYWLVVGLAVVPPLALGNRRFLIPSIIAGLIGASTRRWSRKVSLSLIGTSAVVFFSLTVIPFIRSAGSRTDDAGFTSAFSDRVGSEGIWGSIEKFFVSYDTEMYSYIAYAGPQIGSTSVPWGLGRGTFGDLLIAPMPAAFGPPRSWSNTLLTGLFGGTCQEGICPVPSVFGTLFFDFGLVGVVVASYLLGSWSQRWTSRYERASGSRLVALVVVAAVAPVAARGNFPAQVSIALQVAVAALAVDWWVRQARPGRAGPLPVAHRRSWRGRSSVPRR